MARQRIVLAAEEAEELIRRSRATTVSVRDRQRAEIILLSAQGLTQQRIAEQLGISRLAVNRWVGRFALRRLEGVERSRRARAQAVVAAGSGAAGARASGDAAAPSGAMELPHDGTCRGDLAGQRAAPVGCQ
jgi:DNA-binding CsgD family transcriptional regulator